MLARCRFSANPNPSSRNLRKLMEKWGQVRFLCTFQKKRSNHRDSFYIEGLLSVRIFPGLQTFITPPTSARSALGGAPFRVSNRG